VTSSVLSIAASGVSISGPKYGFVAALLTTPSTRPKCSTAFASSRNGGGSIVNMASVAGIRAAPMQGIYGATKAAVISMTQTLAFELGSSNIRVNAIAPGLVETKFASALIHNPMIHDQVVKRTPLGRHAQPAELAGAATYLLSDAASFTTGTVLVVDGGMTSA